MSIGTPSRFASAGGSDSDGDAGGHPLARDTVRPATPASVRAMWGRKGRKQADISSRKASATRDLSGVFLEGTESSVTGIEPQADVGFRDAWEETADGARDQSFDSAIDVGQDDSEVRNLDRNRIGAYLGVAVLLAGIGAVAFFGTRALTAPDAGFGVRASTDPDRNVVASPLAEREYSEPTGPVVVDPFAALDEVFVSDGTSGEMLLASADALPEQSQGTMLTGLVFWAGRLHTVVASTNTLAVENDCVVTSLVTGELEVVDVAGFGQCPDDFAATGDRVACRGDNVAVLEVWPLNPDAVTEPRIVGAVRSRIEISLDGNVISRRGSVNVSGIGGETPLVSAAATLGGAPGDVVTIQVGDLSVECTLVDRGDVDVRLLPG